MPDGGIWPQVLSWGWEKLSENREEIQQKLAALFRWFRSRRSDILILGAGGTGKTTLGRILSGQIDYLMNLPGTYAESFTAERYSGAELPGTEIVVLPGQERHREATWEDHLKDVRTGKVRGIVLVGSYGYHSISELSYKHHRLYHGSKEGFLRAYSRDRRQEEVRILRQLASCLGNVRKRCWLFSVVTKQDLWWHQRLRVGEFYRQREYGGEIRRLLERLDPRLFRHEYVFASLVLDNLVTAEAELLKATAAGYDQRRQVTTLRQLIEALDKFKDWENER